MTRQQLEAKVRTIIVDQLGVEDEEVNADAHIMNDLGADSLDVIELVMAAEAEFDIEIPDEDVFELETVGAGVNYLAGKLGVE